MNAHSVTFLLSIIFNLIFNTFVSSQNKGVNLLNKYLEYSEIYNIDSIEFNYGRIKNELIHSDLNCFENSQLYEMMLSALPYEIDKYYENFLDAISPTFLTECVQYPTSEYCPLNYFLDDCQRRNFSDSVIIYKVLNVLTSMKDSIKQNYDMRLQELCDSLDKEDQKYRTIALNGWFTLPQDSIIYLMTLQQKIDESNFSILDKIIIEYGIPSFENVNSQIFPLLLLHMPDPSKYLSLLDDMVLRKSIYIENYKAVFYRYFLSTDSKIKTFPFIYRDNSDNVVFLEKAFDGFWQRMNYNLNQSENHYFEFFIEDDELVSILKANIPKDINYTITSKEQNDRNNISFIISKK